ncbi:hypothetical protein F5Y11DRAFT_258822 [Daldinia sp. FL1419]|nr:hypothetical protein F5Y11DRAFT_258822 [Daldinia sp. FL1419]
MDALLNPSRGNLVCTSVQDVQDRLHHLLASKSSETRAEHASFAFELRHNVIFDLNADAENATADGVINPTEQSPHQPITRSVNTLDIVQNQPGDDPVLQRAVAKHIIGAMGIVDNSSWTVRKVSRDTQGWSFTYICKDSLQAWNRANAKNAEKNVIGSYSGPGSLDPVNASRPAFDCRGTLVIAFSKPLRGVIIKYDHTPIHKTVGQLVDLIAPNLPPPPVNAGSQRTPKAKRPRPAEGEEGSRKKRSRKKDKAPEAPMGGPPLGDDQGGGNNVESRRTHHDGSPIITVPNVPADEMERRRQAAMNLLNQRGIDPATLSEEQFNIFANQAPDLQETSLDMLARYGAERLRIVHPDDKDANSTPVGGQSIDTTPAAIPGQASATGTNEETPTKKKRPRKRKSEGAAAEVSIGDGAVVPIQQSGEVGTTTSALKLTGKKTRGGCDTCRNKKIKCTKEHPSCSVCMEAGVECIYLPPKPRRKRAGITEVVENEDSDLPGEREEYQARMESQVPVSMPIPTTQMPEQEQTHIMAPSVPIPAPVPDPDCEEFIPDPNILSGPVEHLHTTTQSPATQYYQSHDSGLAYSQNPHPSSVQTAMPTAMPTTMPTLTFPESQARETQSESPNLTYSTTHQTEHPSGLAFPQPTPTTSQKPQSMPMSSQRSLPTNQNKQTPIQTPVPPPAISQHASNWNSPSRARHTTTASPGVTQQQASRRSMSRKSEVEVRQQTNESARHSPVVPQVAPQIQRQPSPSTSSPYQNTTRAQSRQDHRSQTSTPVASTTRPPPQAPQAAVSASYNTAPSTSIPSYDPYPRYDSTASSQYDNASNDQGSTRIAYEPGTYQAHTAAMTSASYSSAPAYDYSRTTGSSNPLSQALNSSSTYNNTNAATSQWPASQTRSRQTHAQPQASNAYPMASTTSTSNSYSTSSAKPQTSHQNTAYAQSQPQSYNSYQAQQTGANQQSQQTWYNFHTNNSSSTSTSQSGYSSNRNGDYGSTAASNQSAYSSHRPNVSSYAGHSYGSGSDDQSLYELLRANNSTN